MADEPKGYVLDAGGLGAIDGRDESAKRVARVLAHALYRDLEVIVPAGALAQVFYDGKKQAQLSKLIARPYVLVAPLDRTAAKEIGPLRKKTAHNDVVDVHVAWLARTRDFAVVTSDPKDMTSLGVSEDRVLEV